MSKKQIVCTYRLQNPILNGDYVLQMGKKDMIAFMKTNNKTYIHSQICTTNRQQLNFVVGKEITGIVAL